MKSKLLWPLGLVVFYAYGVTGCSIDAQGNRVVGTPGFAAAGLYNKSTPGVSIRSRSELIEKYLANRELTPIEGVWIGSSNNYEVAIIRNTTERYKEYDYLGVIADSRVDTWNKGDIKLILKETASPDAYSGSYFDFEHNEIGTMFLLPSPNLLEFTLSDQFGRQQRTTFVRNYPKTPNTGPLTRSENSTGTGFFVASDSIATNWHVVKEARRISVLVGSTELKADLLLKDAQNDLALLRVDRSKLQGATSTIANAPCFLIGNSDEVKSGDAVFAIGYPLSGLLATSPSIGQGLVSNVLGVDNDPRVFQTSIPIQAGNSGSPLLNQSGHVIGVVTSTLNNKKMLTTTGVLTQNVNFAIKSSYLKSMISMTSSSPCGESSKVKQPVTARDMQDAYASNVVLIRVSR
ncbi:MAG: serine protease [Nitrospira sp.]|nr:serine protease [Nitrospira sp.]QOJ36071.1 MAG: trypsin-like peptidase domain-containing protein [Nitrospira sp.]